MGTARYDALTFHRIVDIHMLNTFGYPVNVCVVDFARYTLFEVGGLVAKVPDRLNRKVSDPKIAYRFLRRIFTPAFKRRRAMRHRLLYAKLEPHGA